MAWGREVNPGGVEIILDFAEDLRAWQVQRDRVGYACFSHKEQSPMTNRVTYAPQDFQKMCKQAERDHESKKLLVLMERVKRQIAERESPGSILVLESPSARATGADSGVMRLPSRSVPFER